MRLYWIILVLVIAGCSKKEGESKEEEDRQPDPIEEIMPIVHSNPVIRHMYTADPSAHVWADGRLYVYASHDIDPPRGCDLMDQYHG